MAERIKQINPQVEVVTHKVFYSSENATEIIYSGLSYVVDAVDTVTAKLQIICRCKELNVPVISCMGAGNKLDPTQFEVVDIQKTSVCPLAKVVRKELRKRGHIKGVKVVYSKEMPLTPLPLDLASDCSSKKRQIPGSISFVPSVAGLIAASVVVRDLLQ
jgi:tRNA A37 threonylcarbamoyladenosine dehydratase